MKLPRTRGGGSYTSQRQTIAAAQHRVGSLAHCPAHAGVDHRSDNAQTGRGLHNAVLARFVRYLGGAAGADCTHGRCTVTATGYRYPVAGLIRPTAHVHAHNSRHRHERGRGHPHGSRQDWRQVSRPVFTPACTAGTGCGGERPGPATRTPAAIGASAGVGTRTAADRMAAGAGCGGERGRGHPARQSP